MNNQIKNYYLDANCLVKLVLDENSSQELKKYFYEDEGSVFFTTSFCFYEALGVLKTKYIQKRRADNITKQIYYNSCIELCELVNDENIQIEDISFRQSVYQAELLSQKYQIDLSDSFQLVTLKSGMIAKLEIDDEPILISEDKKLLIAARRENLKAKKIDELGDIENYENATHYVTSG